MTESCVLAGGGVDIKQLLALCSCSKAELQLSPDLAEQEGVASVLPVSIPVRAVK